ncbi:hypothetical protein ACJX0J_018896 [Zea mays]
MNLSGLAVGWNTKLIIFDNCLKVSCLIRTHGSLPLPYTSNLNPSKTSLMPGFLKTFNQQKNHQIYDLQATFFSCLRNLHLHVITSIIFIDDEYFFLLLPYSSEGKIKCKPVIREEIEYISSSRDREDEEI